MPGISFVELVLIFGLFLVLFGPKELPQVARGILKLLNEMKSVFYSLQKEWGLLPGESQKPQASPGACNPSKKPSPPKRDPLKPPSGK